MWKNPHEKMQKAAKILQNAEYAVAFSGAGISVESGIPPFRGPQGLWSKYDASILDIQRYLQTPEKVWPTIKAIFYDYWGTAEPNSAHISIAKLQKENILQDIITQNIDFLHQKAGSNRVWEFHGTLKTFSCIECDYQIKWEPEIFNDDQPPYCPECGALLKPDFVFFGEAIPLEANQKSTQAMRRADVVLVIGTTGGIMPASLLPYAAKENGATIIEVNVEPSNYTDRITDIFLQGKAGTILPQLVKEIDLNHE